MSIVMGDPKTVLEGSVKYRDKKKWKSRWAVVSKLSPVADCLHIQLYRDSKERCKNGPTKASLSLEEFLGMETGFTLDKESNTMALICSELVVALAFDNRELLIQWQVKIRANLVEEQQFLVQIAHVPAKSKLPCGPARLHLQDHTFCLVSGVPPRLLGTWPIKELRRFGVIEGKFCFEGGSLCGRGEGLHVLLTNQSEELSQAMDLASKGKLLGKRKTLSRKNSVLESSTRYPLHKRTHHDSSKSTGGDSSRQLLSSGSESSTCDACSEILRSAESCGDDMLMYNSSSASMKASSCRIHYRWPSCLSRWGQSSTTASDVESADTVSVTLSDFQGSSQSATISKTSGHGQSLSCLCDSQGTWPFNQCSKCGRHFYSRNSLQNCRNKQLPSPENPVKDSANGFSPQWTMDSLVGSSPDTQQSRKDSAYQLMNPPSDRASLCSHASHSSSASAASSSGSEYSVPRNYLETLYDRPKTMQHALHTTSNAKTSEPRRTSATSEHPILSQVSTENCILCPCHEPIKDWVTSSMSTSQEKLFGSQECACWNKLSMSVRSEVDIRLINGRKSASANPSPNSSPKKAKYNSLRPSNNAALDCNLTCTCGKTDPYANYSTPRSALVNQKEVPVASAQANGNKDAKTHVPAIPSEDYDVPKKYTDLLSNCDMNQKASAMKTVTNGPSCSCMSACKIVQNIELFKMASKHSYNHQHGSLNPPSADALQMCACQRVMLWAGSLVPCLGPQRATVDSGWQYSKSLNSDNKSCARAWFDHSVAVCNEPHKTAEIVMVNGGKLKHVLRGASTEATADENRMPPFARPRSSTISYPLLPSRNSGDSTVFNYANIEFSQEANDKSVRVSEDASSTNYANIEFAETLSLYENSNVVLSRLETEEKNVEHVYPDKPPLPPRSQMPTSKKNSENVNHSDLKDRCNCKQYCIRRSPKKATLKQVNGSAYEMMCYQNPPGCTQDDDDYLMMQPLCAKTENSSSPSKQSLESQNLQSAPNALGKQNEETEVEQGMEPALPLRPFMPYSYPSVEMNDSSEHDGICVESLSRKNQLINDELHLRSMRSNSLSELKKKVLMRKRSSSVDGKNNGYHQNEVGTEVESVPASPVCSPRPVQRKNSLFSKLNLRSKEKSMSTNEIAPPIPISSCNSSILNNMHKSGLHRSADCLKLNEDYVNSDDDLNSDASDFSIQKESSSPSSMKRSSSVPCRAGMPNVCISSPVRTNGTIMELNDLNKDSSTVTITESDENCDELGHRKYSLDSHERPKQKVRSNCDNVYRQECLDECDTVMELQGVLRRNHTHIPLTERGALVENCRSATSSCSSSDISDYMESLSFISRSSSSSSGSTSSADYVRSEDLYHLKPLPRPLPKNNFSSSNCTVPSVHHQSRHSPVEINGVDVTNRFMNHRGLVDISDSSSAGGSSSGSYQDPKPCYLGKDESKMRPCTSVHSNRDSRSSTSSTSSLSTSPSVTDYSSSTSSSPPCQNVSSRPIYGKSQQDTKPEPDMAQRSMFVYSTSKNEPEKTS